MAVEAPAASSTRAAADGASAGSVVDYGVTRDGLIQLRRRWPAAGPEPSPSPGSDADQESAPSPGSAAGPESSPSPGSDADQESAPSPGSAAGPESSPSPGSGAGRESAPSPDSVLVAHQSISSMVARPARAVVYVLHGVAEHSGRYEHVGSALAGRGFETVATDHRGHGRSGGRRGHVDRWSQYLDDVEDQMAEVRGLGLPVVMLGHSLGGLMALSYCVEGRPGPDLLAVSAPALGYALDSPQKLLYLAGPVLASLAAAAPVPINRDLSLLSSDPETAARAAADPLWNRDITVSLGWQLLRAMAHTRARLDRLEVPVMCVHGGDDRLVPAASSEILASAAGAERRVYEGLRHEVFNEPAGLAVLAEIIDWIESNLPCPA